MTAPGDLITQSAAGADLAQAGTATADSTYSTYYPSRAIDGNDATDHVSTNPVANRWVEVDLGASYAIGQWRAVQSSSGNSRADVWALQSSTDNSTWTTLASGSSAFVDTGILALAAPITARYWRLYATSGGSLGWSLYTLQLFGNGVPVRLPIGADGRVLTVDPTTHLPAWDAAAGGGINILRVFALGG